MRGLLAWPSARWDQDAVASHTRLAGGTSLEIVCSHLSGPLTVFWQVDKTVVLPSEH